MAKKLIALIQDLQRYSWQALPCTHRPLKHSASGSFLSRRDDSSHLPRGHFFSPAGDLSVKGDRIHLAQRPSSEALKAPKPKVPSLDERSTLETLLAMVAELDKAHKWDSYEPRTEEEKAVAQRMLWWGPVYYMTAKRNPHFDPTKPATHRNLFHEDWS
jgi:hypothetical protein